MVEYIVIMPQPIDQEWLLLRFKALADENRLLLLTRLADGEHNVMQIAEMLNLSEPTVSHHLNKLREAAFVTMRAHGNQHFYTLNSSGLALFKNAVGRIEQIAPAATLPPSDDSWIDALPPDFSAEDRALLRAMTKNGRLDQLPSLRHKPQRLQVMLRWLASQFAPDAFYTEKEVNTILKTAHDDFASLRRYLVDFGYLQRELGGRKYWLASAEGGHDFGVGEDDV